MSMNDHPTDEEEAAAARSYEDTIRRGTQLTRRRRLSTAVAVAVVVVAVGVSVPLALRNRKHPQTTVDVISPPRPLATTTTAPVTEAAQSSTTLAAEQTATTQAQSAPARHPTPIVQPPDATEPTPATEPTSTTQPTSIGPGTASLTFSGVLAGQLVDAVSYCHPRPNAGSDITVNGTLNGTPWVLFIQSYTGQNGVWQVLTGEAGGATGMRGQGYANTATYPATVAGAAPVDWTHGATLDVQLTSGSGQAPAGDLRVQGTISCG